MVKRGVYWCPTIYVGVYVAEGRAKAGAPIWVTMVDLHKQAFAKAVRKGVKIAYGTDAGGYAWTEPQARELSYMVRYGMTPLQAIESATRVGAELLGREADIGTVEAGRLRGHHRRGRRPAAGHRGAGARALRDEGRADGALGQALAQLSQARRTETFRWRSAMGPRSHCPSEPGPHTVSSPRNGRVFA